MAKKEKVQVLMTEDEVAALQLMAESADRSVSSYVRHLILVDLQKQVNMVC